MASEELWIAAAGREEWNLLVAALPRLASRVPGLELVPIRTGCGLRAARRCLEARLKVHTPLFVINLGTCGHASKPRSTVRWMDRVGSEGQEWLELDCLKPAGGTLFSVKQPARAAALAALDPHHVDMEAYALASVCHAAGVPMAVLKVVTDAGSLEDYKAAVGTAMENALDELSAGLHALVMSKPKSIGTMGCVIPVFNRPDLVLRAVASVRAQSRAVDQLVVVNDGSTDLTLQTVKEHVAPDEVCTIPHSGVAAARNFGVQILRTDWVLFLDSDDEWLPWHVDRVERWLASHGNIRIAQDRDRWMVCGEKKSVPLSHQKKAGDLFADGLKRCVISPSAVALQRSLFLEAGGFNPDLPACEDYDLWLRICKTHPVGLVEREGIVRHQGHGDQLSATVPMLDKYRLASLRALVGSMAGDGRLEAVLVEIARRENILNREGRHAVDPEFTRLEESAHVP